MKELVNLITYAVCAGVFIALLTIFINTILEDIKDKLYEIRNPRICWVYARLFSELENAFYKDEDKKIQLIFKELKDMHLKEYGIRGYEFRDDIEKKLEEST